jgi:light-regulated signal transduction histidine kinase (bacteriophytochrome)
MHRMVKDLLDYTKIIDPTGSAPPVVDAAESLAQAINNLERSIDHTGATVTHDPLPALPVHSTHLVQLFQNLISNSLKYRRPEEPPRVHITATRDGADWLFAVNDNGIGFDPVHAERIFGLFKRLHTRVEYPGTGIGLAICTRIVEHYGGRIWADAVPNRGATFFFALPAGGGH